MGSSGAAYEDDLMSEQEVAGMMGGAAYLQTGGPFSKASLNTTSVFNLLGGVATVDQVKAGIGLLTADGKGGAVGWRILTTSCRSTQRTREHT